MHSIATMGDLLVANPGRRALITANGGYLTKHSFGVYSTEPSPEFRWEDVQSAVDREATPDGVIAWEGGGTLGAGTTPYNRDGQPEKAFVAVRTPDGSRTLAVITDGAAAQATVRDDIGGAKVVVAAAGRAA